MLIGQEAVLNEIVRKWQSSKFPRLCVLEGTKDWGKLSVFTEFVKEYTDGELVVIDDPKFDNIKHMVDSSKLATHHTFFYVDNASEMAFSSQNALLKTLEEPPANAYFILAVEHPTDLLSTILSRNFCTFILQGYSQQELTTYAQCKHGKSLGSYTAIATCPHDIDLLVQYGAEEFSTFVEKVVDNIAYASDSNALKIPDMLSFNDKEGYDGRLFLKAVESLCYINMLDCIARHQRHVNNSAEPLEHWARAVVISDKFIGDLSRKGINTKMVLSQWVLEIKDVLKGIYD